MVSSSHCEAIFAETQNQRARLNSIEDRNGNRILCTYAANGKLDFVMDAAGRVLDFSYDAAGFLSTITDWMTPAEGGPRVWSYAVDANHDLVSYMDPVQRRKPVAERRAWAYEYYTNQSNAPLNHNLKKFRRPVDRDEDGVGDYSMEFVYYTNDAVYAHTDSLGNTTRFEYNPFNGRTDVTHPDGGRETHFYDSHMNVVRFVSPEGRVEENEYDKEKKERTVERDPFGFETRMTYDAAGNVTSRTDHVGVGESWTYNQYGAVTSHTDREGNVQQFVYDANGNLLSERATIDGKEEVLRDRRYDARGNLLEETRYAAGGRGGASVTRFEYDAAGIHPVRVIDATGTATRFEYDSLGRVTEIAQERRVVENGSPRTVTEKVTQEYDALGRVVRVKNSSGVIVEVEYDANGLETRRMTHVPAKPGPGYTTRVDRAVTYDALDRVVASENALHDVVTQEYDVMGRPVRVTSPLGATVTNEYDHDGKVIRSVDAVGAATEFSYDIMGRKVAMTDALGRTTRVEYDPLGRVRRTYGPATSGEVLIGEVLEFDALSRPVRVRDAAGRETQTVYDELGRVRAVTVAVGTADEATTTFVYDLMGRLTSRTDAEGHTVSVRYDKLGRAIETTDALGRKQYATYDEAGNVIESVNAAGEVVGFEYDARRLLKRVVAPDSPSVEKSFSYDELGRLVFAKNAETTLTLEYDTLDRVTSVRDAKVGTWRQVYDADGRVVQKVLPKDATYGFSQGIVLGYQYDARGRLTGVTDPAAGSWRFEYDAIGRMVRRSDPFGTAVETKFAKEGYVDTVTLRGASGVLDVFDYGGYDALGNPHTLDTNEGRTDIAYDARDRVTNVTYPLVGGTRASEMFAYDRVGNRTLHVDRSGVSRTYQFDDAYQLSAIVSTSNPSNVFEEFEYDAVGRRTAHYSGGTLAHEYVYNAASELVEVATGSATVSIGYGPDGARYRSTDATGTDYFFGASLEYRDGHPLRVVRAGDQVLAEVTSTATRGFAYDASQNLTHEIFGGAITATAHYEAFGATRATNGSVTTERGFASAMRESTTGLIAMGARHYDPATGTFLQTDPLYLTTNQLYAYANNNPYAYWDPSGLSSQNLSWSDPSYADAYMSNYISSQLSTTSSGSAWAGSGYSTPAVLARGSLPPGVTFMDPIEGPIRSSETMAPWEIYGLAKSGVSLVRGSVGIATGLYTTARTLRSAYVAEAQSISLQAEKYVLQGTMDPMRAAQWAVDARNALKIESREVLPRVVQWGIEQRNIWRYQNPVGPSLEKLLSNPQATPMSVIKGAGRTNSLINWMLRVK